MTSSGFSIERLSVSYKSKQVVNAVTLQEICPGTLVALVGPNGAGKSTLLKAVAGIARPDGKIILQGRNLANMNHATRAKLIGYMPQNFPFVVSLNVLESVVFSLEGTSERRPDRKQNAAKQAAALLEKLGLMNIALKPLAFLSGGERQMAGFAQAVARDPSLLLLDEPVSALDPARQFTVMRMARMAATEGRIVIVVLHDLTLACQWADQIVVMQNGKLYANGPPDITVTPHMLEAVYGVKVRVERCSQGRMQIMTDDVVYNKRSLP